MKESREQDGTEQHDKEKLYTLDEIMSESEVEKRTLSDQERADLLQEIHGEILSEVERDELVKGINGNLKSRNRQAEFLSKSKLNPRELQEANEWEANMWEPQIMGTPIDSEKQVMTILQDLIPGILKHQRFETLRHQIFMHMRTTQKFDHRNKVTYGEISDFAKQNDYPSSTIEAWVLRRVQPNSYRIINENALTREKGEVLVSEMREKLHGLDTQTSLDACLDTPYHEARTKTLPSFKKDYENACGFYRLLDELADGGVLSDIFERVGLSRLTARQYVEEKRIPRLIRKVLNRSLDEIKNIDERVLIQDEVQYEQLLSRNPHIIDLDSFDDMDRHMRGYLRLKQMQQSDTLPAIPQEELASGLGISGPRLNVYLSEKSSPKLQSVLLIHEDARLLHEGGLSSLAFGHRIEPELVYRELHQYRNLEKIDIHAFTASLQTIYEQTAISSKVRWIDLQRYAPSGQEWFRGFVKICKKHKSHIEDGLNTQLGLVDKSTRLRLGVVGSRIYLRLENVAETDWMQLYSDEMFHFHNPDCIERLLSESKARFDIKGDISLSCLIHQTTDYNKSITKRGMNTDLHHNAPYVKGSTLSLLLDSCDMTIQDIEDDIASIGRIDRHLIRNPKFSEDSLEIDKAFAQLFGAGLSDGHINQFRVFCYSEANANRIRIFQRHVNFFGDIDYTLERDENGNCEVRYSAVLGRMLEKRGFPVGDKTVQNRGIPDFILNGSIEVQTEYLRQLWAEDGHFILGEKNHTYFGWTRGVSLLDPEKDLKYNNESFIMPEMIQLIEKYGTYHEKFNGRFYPRFLLDVGKLKRHDEIETPAERELAQRLQTIIYGAKPSLLISEESLLENMGVESVSSPTEVWYYLGTGRVSVLWRARTKTRDGAMMVAIQAPPDDIEKRLKVQSWIESQQSRHQKVLRELEKGHKYQMSPTDD